MATVIIGLVMLAVVGGALVYGFVALNMRKREGRALNALTDAKSEVGSFYDRIDRMAS